jgi:WD40 repeat protein
MTEAGRALPAEEGPEEALSRLWRQGQRMDLGEFLTGFPGLGPAELVGVLRVDQRERWQVGERVPAEAYLRRYPLEGETEAVVELVYGEYLLREELGEAPTLEEYRWRFPAFADRLRQQIDLHRALGGQAAPPPSAHTTTPMSVPPDLPEAPAVPGYEILGELGRGGMGVVYKARHRALNRLVALKMILAGGHAGPEQLARFRGEAEAVARLKHPNVVQVYDVGEAGGLPYFSLELVEGGSLDQKLAGTPLPPDDAACLVEKLARAMATAHAEGLVHRDLKPANVLLGSDGTPKITDFGLAKKLDVPGVTASGAVMGTPSYMAPEQAGGKSREIGPACDVYALGAILYECLTGRPPFRAATKLDTLLQVLAEEPVPPRQLNARLPVDLETICLKCLQKEAARRYASAGELADDLRRYQEGRPILARPVGRWTRAAKWVRRNPAVAAMSAALVLLLALLSVGGVVMTLNLRFALGQARDRQAEAEAAERGQREQTLEALLAEARAKRYSGRVGQRFDTLAAVRKAVALARELDKPAAVFAELRDLAVAALALPDFRVVARKWDGWPRGSFGLDFDPVALRLYARGDRAGNVSVRRLADDAVVARLPGAGRARKIVFGADGRTLLLHDTKSGVLERWQIGGPAPTKVATISTDVAQWRQSRDGRRLLALHPSPQGNWCEVLDMPAGRPRFEYRSAIRDNTIGTLAALSPDGHWLAWVDGTYGSPQRNRVLLFDLDSDTKSPARTLLNPGNVASPVWHPDSRTLAIGNTNTNDVYVWDAPSGRRLLTLGDQKGGAPVLGMSPSGQLLTSWSHWAGLGPVFWHPHTGKLLLRTSFPWSAATPVQDGRLYTASIEKTQIILRTVEPSPVFRTLVPDPAGPPRRDCRDVTIHPAGRLLAVGHSNGVALFDLLTGLQVGRLNLGWNLFARFDPSNGDLLTYGQRGLFRWPVRITPGEPETITVGPPRVLLQGGGTMANFDVSRDGKVIVVANRSETVVLRQKEKHLLAVLLGPLTDNRFVHLSPDGRWALTVRHDARRGALWDARTGRQVGTVPVGTRGTSPHHSFYGTFFSPDGRWLTDGRRRRQVGTWKEGPGTPVADGPGAVAFSPDGALFVGQKNDEAVHLVDAASGKTLVHLGLPEQSRCWFAAFSPDGTQLLLQAADHHHVYAWDLRALRRHLADLALDWNAPPLPPAPAGPRRLPPVVTVKPIDPSARPPLLVLLENPTLWTRRGQSYARLGQWARAGAAFTRALEQQPEDHWLWYRALVVQAQLGNKEEYRRLCRGVLERFGGTTAPPIADKTVKACLLLAGVNEDPQKLADLADLAVRSKPNHPQMSWFCLARGLSAYRAGRFSEAASWLTRSLAKEPRVHVAATARFVLAMTQQQQGQAAAARVTLTRAQQITSRRMPTLQRSADDSWIDWLINDLLRREAEALLVGKKVPGK